MRTKKTAVTGLPTKASDFDIVEKTTTANTDLGVNVSGNFLVYADEVATL